MSRPSKATDSSTDLHEDSVALLSAVMQGTPDLVAAVDVKYRFMIFNDAYRRECAAIYGVKVRVGMHFSEMFPHLPDDIERAASVWGRALSGEIYTEIQPFGDAALSRRMYELRYFPMRTSDGTIIGGCHWARDVTEKIHAEQELREALEARDNFLAVASHELKTPLTALMLQSQMHHRYLQANTGDALSLARLRKFATAMILQESRLARLVDDMLDASRIAAGKLSMVAESVDFSALARDTVERFASQLAAAGCAVDATYEAGLRVRGDPFRLEQVVNNLLTNVIKYAPGQAVVITAALRQGYAVLSVRDHGPGIAPADIERIFEPYERISAGHHINGLGLGLHISRQIAQAHAGTLTARSDAPDGSEFMLALPPESA